jgi:hypothetical protein
MKTISLYENLCTVSDVHDDRVLSAVGDTAIVFDDDFVAPAIVGDALAGWTTTLVEGGASESTITAGDGVGGMLVLTTDAADNDGINLTAKGEAFLPTTTDSLSFYTRLKISDATQSDFFVGLAQTDTAVLDNLPPRIGFRKVDGSTALMVECEGTATTSVESIHTVVDDTFVELEFFFESNGDTLRYYIDGVKKGEITPGANLPTTEMTPSIHFLTGTTVSKVMTVDRVRCIQLGR